MRPPCYTKSPWQKRPRLRYNRNGAGHTPPAQRYSYRQETGLNVLGIDMGGTKSIVGIADGSGNMLDHERIETPGSLGPDPNIAAINEAAHRLIDRTGVTVDSVGVGCGGPLDRAAGIVHMIPNQPGWEDTHVVGMFEDEFGVPVLIENDANAAALGEMTFGEGKGVSDFVYFTVSTGIGGGIVAGGKIYRGHSDNAAEFGHQKIRSDGPPCTCGDRGCLESLASGSSIARIARENMSAHPNTIIHGWISSRDEVTAELVARAAKQRDPFASKVWDEAMRNLGLGVANVVSILNPQLVIIGGGVSKAGEMLFDPVRLVVVERTMPALSDGLRIVPAAHRDLAVLYGLFALAIQGAQ